MSRQKSMSRSSHEQRTLIYRRFLDNISRKPDYREVICPKYGMTYGDLYSYVLIELEPSLIDNIPFDARDRITKGVPEHIGSCKVCTLEYEIIGELNESLSLKDPNNNKPNA